MEYSPAVPNLTYHGQHIDEVKGTLWGTHGRGPHDVGTRGALGRLRESLFMGLPFINPRQDAIIQSLWPLSAIPPLLTGPKADFVLGGTSPTTIRAPLKGASVLVGKGH